MYYPELKENLYLDLEGNKCHVYPNPLTSGKSLGTQDLKLYDRISNTNYNEMLEVPWQGKTWSDVERSRGYTFAKSTRIMSVNRTSALPCSVLGTVDWRYGHRARLSVNDEDNRTLQVQRLGDRSQKAANNFNNSEQLHNDWGTAKRD